MELMWLRARVRAWSSVRELRAITGTSDRMLSSNHRWRRDNRPLKDEADRWEMKFASRCLRRGDEIWQEKNLSVCSCFSVNLSVCSCCVSLSVCVSPSGRSTHASTGSNLWCWQALWGRSRLTKAAGTTTNSSHVAHTLQLLYPPASTPPTVGCSG